MLRPTVPALPIRALRPSASWAFRLLSIGRGVACGLVLTSGLSAVASAQVTVQTLIGKAVTDDTHNTEVNNAITRFRDRDVDGCRAILERIHSEDLKVPPPGIMMATLWLSANQVQAARAELDQTAAKYPADPESYLVLADLAFQERRVTDAAVLFDRAAAMTEAFTGNSKRKRDFQIRTHAGEAAVAEARGQWDKALEHIREWVEIDPDSPSARQRLGSALFQSDKPEEALAAFREARKLDDKLIQPELLLARLYDQAKKTDKSREMVVEAVSLAGDDLNVRIGAANWFLNHGDTAAARENAQVALELDPKNLDARLVNGTIARVLRDFDSAERFFSEAHTQSPRNLPAADSLALVLAESAEKEKLQQALELAETNVAMVKDNQQLQLATATTLAWVYYKLGRVTDSEKILAQVAQNNALTADGAYYIARILMDKGEKEEARRLLNQVMANEPMFANRAEAEKLLESLSGGADSVGK
jgi:tetratricopeptide (TPR) repeat protein